MAADPIYICICMCIVSVLCCVGHTPSTTTHVVTPLSIPTQKDPTMSTELFPVQPSSAQVALSMEAMTEAHNQEAVVQTPRMKRLYQKLEELASGWKNTAFEAFRVANFIFSIIAMMVSHE